MRARFAGIVMRWRGRFGGGGLGDRGRPGSKHRRGRRRLGGVLVARHQPIGERAGAAVEQPQGSHQAGGEPEQRGATLQLRSGADIASEGMRTDEGVKDQTVNPITRAGRPPTGSDAGADLAMVGWPRDRAARPRHAYRPVVAALALAIVPLAGWAAVRAARRCRATAASVAAHVPQARAARLRDVGAVRGVPPGAVRVVAPRLPPHDDAVRDARHRARQLRRRPRSTAAATTSTLSRRGDEFFVEMVDPLWQYEVDIGQRDRRSPGEAPPRVDAPDLAGHRLAPHAGVLGRRRTTATASCRCRSRTCSTTSAGCRAATCSCIRPSEDRHQSRCGTSAVSAVTRRPASRSR